MRLFECYVEGAGGLRATIDNELAAAGWTYEKIAAITSCSGAKAGGNRKQRKVTRFRRVRKIQKEWQAAGLFWLPGATT